MDRNELKYWIAFTRVKNIGAVRTRILERRFGSLSDAWRSREGDLRAAGIGEAAASSLLLSRNLIDPEREIDALDSQQCAAYTWRDPEYPARLKEVSDAPPVLFVRGALEPQDEQSIAIVGNRGASEYGREAAYRMAADLAHAGLVVVSGLALGVDSMAHHAALEAGKRTIAVLASGLDIIYPHQNRRLAAQIVENGALITEYPMGVQPKPKRFPRRNRILSGVTLGVLVVEAGETSGALITASHAIDQNREVFAVPGGVFSPNSRGVNALIQRGEAKLVQRAEDVLEELHLPYEGRQEELPSEAGDAVAPSDASDGVEIEARFPANSEESKILYQLSRQPRHIDEVIRASELSNSVVSGLLAMMELRGVVRQVGGMHYVRS